MWSGHSCPLPLMLVLLSVCCLSSPSKKATSTTERGSEKSGLLLRRQQISVLLAIVCPHPNNLPAGVDSLGVNQFPPRPGRNHAVEIFDLPIAVDECVIRAREGGFANHKSRVVDAKRPDRAETRECAQILQRASGAICDESVSRAVLGIRQARDLALVVDGVCLAPRAAEGSHLRHLAALPDEAEEVSLCVIGCSRNDA